MPVTITLKNSQTPYCHSYGLKYTEALKKASANLTNILAKIKINNKDVSIKIKGAPSNGLSFFDNQPNFVSSLSKLSDEDIKEANITIQDFVTTLEVGSSNITKEYEILRDKITEYIKQLIADKEATPDIAFETNGNHCEQQTIPQNQQPKVGSYPANDNEVDSLEKEYIKRNDDLHQVRVSYKKTGQAEQARHIVFCNEILKKESNSNSCEEVAKNMVDLISTTTEPNQKRLIARQKATGTTSSFVTKTEAVLDSVDYQKNNGKIEGVNVCYSKKTTEAIANILTGNHGITKEDFIKATIAYRTAIYILIPGSNEGGKNSQYVKYQLTPSNGGLVFEMEKNIFTREAGKFKKSTATIQNQYQYQLPDPESFNIYKTNPEQEQCLWNEQGPQNFVSLIKIEKREAQTIKV